MLLLKKKFSFSPKNRRNLPKTALIRRNFAEIGNNEKKNFHFFAQKSQEFAAEITQNHAEFTREFCENSA